MLGRILTLLAWTLQLGRSQVPITVGLPIVGLAIFAIVVNSLYLRRYAQLMSYFKQFHPNIYEQIRRKPDVGPFYSTGYKHARPLIELAKRSHTLKDAQAENRLADFLQFDRQVTWISSIVIIVGMLIFFILSIAAFY